VRVTLISQHEMHTLHIVTSFVAFPAPPSFSTFSHKLCDFQRKVTEYKMCVLILSTNLSRTFLILSHSARYVQKCRNIFM
jgi:hypothetical protein